MPHDKNNKPLQVGAIVMLACQIQSISEGETQCNVQAQAIERPEGEEHIPVISCNSRFFEQQDRPPIFMRYPNGMMAKTSAIAKAKYQRKQLDAILQEMKATKLDLIVSMGIAGKDPQEGYEDAGEAIANQIIALRHVEDAIMRLGMVLKNIGNPTPYPESKNPDSPVVHPTADGLTL